MRAFDSSRKTNKENPESKLCHKSAAKIKETCAFQNNIAQDQWMPKKCSRSYNKSTNGT